MLFSWCSWYVLILIIFIDNLWEEFFLLLPFLRPVENSLPLLTFFKGLYPLISAYFSANFFGLPVRSPRSLYCKLRGYLSYFPSGYLSGKFSGVSRCVDFPGKMINCEWRVRLPFVLKHPDVVRSVFPQSDPSVPTFQSFLIVS